GSWRVGPRLRVLDWPRGSRWNADGNCQTAQPASRPDRFIAGCARATHNARFPTNRFHALMNSRRTSKMNSHYGAKSCGTPESRSIDPNRDIRVAELMAMRCD